MVQVVNPHLLQTNAPQMFMPQYQPEQQQPSAWDNFQQQFSSSVGQGLGSGIQQGIKEQLRKSVIQKTLAGIPQNASPEQMYQSVLQAPSDVQQQLLPLIELRAAQQKKMQEQQQNQAQNVGFEAALGLNNNGPIQPELQQNNQAGAQQLNPEETDRQRLGKALQGVTDPKHRNEIIKEFNLRKKEEKAERQFAFQQTKKFIDGVNDSYKSTLDTERSLYKMDNLIDKGLSTPALVKTIKFLGLPLSILRNPNNEEYEKESEKLVSGVNEAFRGRILLSEIENFKNRIPTLMNSDEGKKRIISGMKEVLKANKLQYDVTQRILAENGGVPPLDLEQRVDAEVIPQLEEMAQKFRDIMENPESSNKKVTVRNPTTGQSFSIPESDLAAAQAEGFQI